MTTALVTGCSTGIGYATALQLARDGHHVVATMRTPAGSDLADVATAEGLSVELRALDVTADDLEATIEKVLADHGAVDVLVNNAGIGSGGGVVEETDLDSLREMMETNYFGAMRCIRAVLPSMRERGSGCIVNVTSQAGVLAFPAMGSYCASKHALTAASESLAIEVAPFGIRVAVVEPGAIMTPIWGKVDLTPPTGPYAPIRQRLGATVVSELGNASTADDVAACIAEAVATDAPRLHWLIGQGAERNVAVAARIPPEERIALWNHPDEAAFFERMLADD